MASPPESPLKASPLVSTPMEDSPSSSSDEDASPAAAATPQLSIAERMKLFERSTGKDLNEQPSKASGPSHAAPRVLIPVGGCDRCSACDGPVYMNDPQCRVDGVVYHQSCFKCSSCELQLNLRNWSPGPEIGSVVCPSCYKNEFYKNNSYTRGPLKNRSLGAPSILQHILELNSPINSHERLQEATAAFKTGADPYAGSLFHEPPLVLVAHSFTSSILPGQWSAVVVLALFDVVCAIALYIASRGSSLFLPSAYLFNPISLLSCLALSGQSLQMALVAGCLTPGLLGCISIASLAYIRCNPLLPFALLLSKSAMEASPGQRGSSLWSALMRNALSTGIFLASLLAASFVIMGDVEAFWASLRGTYIDPFLMSELQPNIGLHWYIFTEVFPRFYSLFLFVFQLLPLTHVLPIYFRLGAHGGEYARQAHTWSVMSLCVLFQPYPTALDYVMLCELLLLHFKDLTSVEGFTKIYEEGDSQPAEDADKQQEQKQKQQPNNYEQYMILFLSVGTMTLLLHPAMTLLWLGRNTGNPNFLFFSNLTHQGACGAAGAAAVSTSMKVRKEQKRMAAAAARLQQRDHPKHN
ncbi:hypothetical protein FOL47_002036 [Perkinsus chesapeaki]|uniref:LIM zinc-binding domain-containing protein n=1 Tax=Perkinsus chesapeaki TaxID=330153 RepID=A0A7J6MFS2_PERCH|nr:hypothetical protein FOL47_002036 [Perkinsus chesapeaki]